MKKLVLKSWRPAGTVGDKLVINDWLISGVVGET
jgi:hypothetical protein